MEAVLVLQKKIGEVRSVDVARYIGVSKPSVCYAINLLKDGGFLKIACKSLFISDGTGESSS